MKTKRLLWKVLSNSWFSKWQCWHNSVDHPVEATIKKYNKQFCISVLIGNNIRHIYCDSIEPTSQRFFLYFIFVFFIFYFCILYFCIYVFLYFCIFLFLAPLGALIVSPFRDQSSPSIQHLALIVPICSIWPWQTRPKWKLMKVNECGWMWMKLDEIGCNWM